MIACGAGIALGFTKGGETFTGVAAFTLWQLGRRYRHWKPTQRFHCRFGKYVESIGIPAKITITIMGVFVASFAATTLDMVTRLQRYVVGELTTAIVIPTASKRHPATIIAVGTAFILAFYIMAAARAQ